MPDLFCEWNSDLLVTPNGGLQSAVGWDRIRQRIVRNLVTNAATALPDGSSTPADYIWHPDFGIGAGSLVGQVPTQAFQANLVSRINQAVLHDVAVDPGSVPTVVFQQLEPGTWVVYISVFLRNGTTGSVSVSIAN